MSEGKKQRKPKEGGSWKQFWSFFRKVKLSWGWIILSLAVSIVYYAVVTMIPGSTAALYAGDFTTAAIMGLVINYAGTLVLSLASALSQLMADAKSVRAARNSVWKQMMGTETSYCSENDPGRLLSAVTSDTEAAVSALIRLIIGIPSLGIYLMMCMGQISAYYPKLLGVLFVLVPVYILYAVFMGRWVQKTGYAIQSRIGGLTGFLTERIRNLALIKSFATESKEEAGGVTAAADLYKAKVQYQYINGIVGSYTFFTEAVGIIIAVIWDSTLLKKGEIELEAWLAFYLFVPMINTVLQRVHAPVGSGEAPQGPADSVLQQFFAAAGVAEALEIGLQNPGVGLAVVRAQTRLFAHILAGVEEVLCKDIVAEIHIHVAVVQELIADVVVRTPGGPGGFSRRRLPGAAGVAYAQRL